MHDPAVTFLCKQASGMWALPPEHAEWARKWQEAEIKAQTPGTPEFAERRRQNLRNSLISGATILGGGGGAAIDGLRGAAVGSALGLGSGLLAQRYL